MGLKEERDSMSKLQRLNDHLSDSQVDALRDILLAEKERILNKDTDQTQFYIQKEETADPVDEAQANIQASTELRFRNRENFYLKKIEKALSKIEEGTYGLCNECDVQIPFGRLKARITAELCAPCKEESESEEKNNFFKKKSKSLGKTIQELGTR